MKITCPTCSARYSIDDGKVKGKAFKFTCKKCGQTHVYRGTADGGVTAAHEAAASYRPAPQPAGPGPDDPVWHVAVGEEQQGPYTTEQINEYIRANEIDPESYVWKEGMEDWLPVAEVHEFAALWAAQQAGAAPAQAPMQDDQPTTIASFPGMSGQASPPQPGELFSFGRPQAAAPVPSASASPFGAFQAPRGAQAAVASRGGADLFGAQQASPFEGAGDEHDEDVLAGADHAAARAAPSPRVDARQMVGQRNENSILFSLASLQALASSGGRQAAAASPAASQRPGFAGGDGSGLIDIRTVAPTIARKEERTEDIFGMGGGGVAASAAVPVLMKPIRRADDSRKPMYIMVGVIGVFAVAIVVLVAFLLGRDRPTERIIIQQQPGVVAVADTAAVVPASESVADATAAEPAAKAEPDAGTAPDAGSAAEPAGEADPAAKAEDAGDEPAEQDAGSGRTGSRGGRPPRDRPPAAPPTAARDAGTSTGGGQEPARRDAGRTSGATSGSGLEGILGGGSRPAGAGAGQPALPETPSRDDVRNALEGVRGAVRACTGGQAGVAQAAVTFQGSSGRVTGVNVTGDFTGQAATCIANAVRGVRVPPFSRASLTVNFPFRF